MAEREWYQDWFNSPYYHKLYFDRDEEEAERFMTKLLGFLQPAPGSKMMDVACGKGRHSKFLAEHDYNVTGIDISPDSIADAKQYERENLSFYVHDMRLLGWINYFDYVFNLFTSFGYFNTRREHDDAMRTMAGSLKKGGTVVIDYLNVHYIEDRLVKQEKKEIEGTTYEIERWDSENHFFKKITVRDERLQTPIVHTEKVSKFSLGDFTDMLSFQGVQVTDVFGDYQLSPYDVRNTPRMIIVARKP
jgi:SAM-dependent methyltransferase